MIRAAFFLLLSLSATVALAQPSPSTSTTTLKPVLDAVGRCGVFMPPALAQAYPYIRWTGVCGYEGLAEGPGLVSFSTSASATGRTGKVWNGQFRNGFFTGNVVAIEVKPLGERRALVRLPFQGDGNATAWLIARLPADGPLPLCADNIGHVAIQTEMRPEIMHAVPLRRLMQRAATAYRAACPLKVPLRLAVVSQNGLGALDNGIFDEAASVIARASLDHHRPVEELHNFQLVALDAIAIERREQERRAAWQQWREFSRVNWVVYWVRAQNLNASPERYEGKVVALAGRFVRVVAPDMAVLRDERGGEILVRGLPEALLKRGVEMVIAGLSQHRQLLPYSAGKIVTVEATAWRVCQRNACGDYLDWMESQPTPFPWGEDQSRY